MQAIRHERPDGPPTHRALRRCLIAGFWVSTVIAVVIVVLRVMALARPPRTAPPQLAALDAVFASHAAITLAHVLPSLAFVLVAPLVMFRVAALGRWPRRLIYPLGMIVGASGYAMCWHAIGGWAERSAVLIFDTLFLYSLLKALLHDQRAEERQSRRWMVRAIVLLLGIATMRPIMGAFFATSSRTHLAPSQFFGIVFWSGFIFNFAVVELWFRRRRRRDPHRELA